MKQGDHLENYSESRSQNRIGPLLALWHHWCREADVLAFRCHACHGDEAVKYERPGASLAVREGEPSRAMSCSKAWIRQSQGTRPQHSRVRKFQIRVNT